MAKTIGFDGFEGVGKGSEPVRSQHCVACEGMLADALDGALGEVDQAWFDRHAQGCAGCSEMVADAQRGAAWLELLKTSRPEPTGLLLERILAQTSGANGDAGVLPMGQAAFHPQMVPANMPAVSAGGVVVNLLAFRPKVARWRFEPRLAMTAAMAFFSVALTLNLAGVRLNDLQWSDLKPANLKRSYYEASTEALRYYDNLRVVRVMESRVGDMRQTQLDDAVQRQHGGNTRKQPEAKPEEKEPGAKEQRPAGPGVSRSGPGLPEGSQAEPQFHAAEDRVRRSHAGAADGMKREGGWA